MNQNFKDPHTISKAQILDWVKQAKGEGEERMDAEAQAAGEEEGIQTEAVSPGGEEEGVEAGTTSRNIIYVYKWKHETASVVVTHTYIPIVYYY